MTDLLCPDSGRLQLREDLKNGVYVDNLSEQVVTSGEAPVGSYLAKYNSSLLSRWSTGPAGAFTSCRHPHYPPFQLFRFCITSTLL